MTAATAAPDDGDDEQVIDYVPCACGRLAALLLVPDELDVTAAVRCSCGSFALPDGRDA